MKGDSRLGFNYSLSCKVTKSVYDLMQLLAESKDMTVQRLLSHLCEDYTKEEIRKIKNHGLD